MITEFDERVNNSKYYKEFEKSALNALKYIRKNFKDYAKKPRIRGYSNSFDTHTFRDLFDELVSKDGFEIDARSIRHAHGIGNNNEWDVLDKDLNKVGDFSATNNMYQGVILKVKIKGKFLDGFEICSGGFINEWEEI